jgi:hypothetical protein
VPLPGEPDGRSAFTPTIPATAAFLALYALLALHNTPGGAGEDQDVSN